MITIQHKNEFNFFDKFFKIQLYNNLNKLYFENEIYLNYFIYSYKNNKIQITNLNIDEKNELLIKFMMILHRFY